MQFRLVAATTEKVDYFLLLPVRLPDFVLTSLVCLLLSAFITPASSFVGGCWDVGGVVDVAEYWGAWCCGWRIDGL